jgi:GDP-L-fucose synthase
MKSSDSIYVAGHAGMVGSAVCRRLRARGYGRIVTRELDELDLLRQADVEDFFRRERPRVVVLAAAKVGGIHANNTLRADFIYENLQIACNVIHAAHAHGAEKLLFLGSSCIYPKHAPQPIREEHLLSSALEETNEPYAIAKIAGLKLCESFNRQYGTNFIAAMPTNLYGPNDNFNLASSHVLPALLRKFHLARLLREGRRDELLRDLARNRDAAEIGHAAGGGGDAGGDLEAALAARGITAESVEIWGTGTPRREFLHVDDCAAALVFLLEAYDETPFVNIGCGSDVTIGELAEMVREATGFAGAIRFNPEKPDGTPRKLLDVGRLRALGWTPSIALRDGIASTYAWYMQRSTA